MLKNVTIVILMTLSLLVIKEARVQAKQNLEKTKRIMDLESRAIPDKGTAQLFDPRNAKVRHLRMGWKKMKSGHVFTIYTYHRGKPRALLVSESL